LLSVRETWCSTVFSEMKKLRRDLGVGQVARDQSQHLDLPRGEAGRLVRVVARTPRGTRSPMSRNRVATNAAAGRAPAVEDRERLGQRIGRAYLDQRQTLVVRPAHVVPQLRGLGTSGPSISAASMAGACEGATPG